MNNLDNIGEIMRVIVLINIDNCSGIHNHIAGIISPSYMKMKIIKSYLAAKVNFRKVSQISVL